MQADPGLAFVFPGQGSQSVGMVDALAARSAVIEETFREANAALNVDLWRLVREGPAEDLDRTENTQPALLAAGVAAWRARMAGGDAAMPGLLAGHSLGEYTALVCAGVLEFADAVRLVAERGRCMQEAVPAGAGAMAAVLGLDDDAVEAACTEAAQGAVVAPANYNAPGQVVIAGEREAVDRAVAACRERGAKRAVTLPVSVPSHCELMRPAAERFRAALDAAAFRPARVPVVQNVDAEPRREPAAIREALVAQLYRPVQWVRCVRRMRAAGVERVLECGPGKVLAGLIRRIDRDIQLIGDGQ
jgi:[acyl-carrier-protein] S-malonyltransferase